MPIVLFERRFELALNLRFSGMQAVKRLEGAARYTHWRTGALKVSIQSQP
jgi:hypothetical protein